MDFYAVAAVLSFIIMSTLQIGLILAYFFGGEAFGKTIKFRIKHYPRISVVIPVYNEGEMIKETINSVMHADYPKEKLEIIVVDDASFDEKTKRILDEYKRRGIKVFHHKKNQGAAGAKNTGIRHAKGEYVITVDSDTVLRRDTVKKLLQETECGNFDAISGAVKIYKPKNMVERVQYLEYNLIVFLRRILHLLDSVHVTPGALSIYRKKSLDDVGGFERLSITEDQEVAFKMQKNGYKVGSTMDAVAYTKPPNTVYSLVKQRVRWVSGGLWNRINHAELINPLKYGNFSFYGFFFDIIFMLPLLLFFLTMLKIATDQSHWFDRVGVEVFALSFDWISVSFVMATIFLYLFSLYQIVFIEERTKKNTENIKFYDYIVFLCTYGFLWFIVWILSLYKVFIKREYRWGTR